MKRYVALLFAFALLVSCGDDPTDINGSPDANVQISFATQSAGAAPMFHRLALLDDTLTSGGDTLILSSVEIVVREVELKRIEVVDCDTDPDDSCEKFEAGPFLVALPLDGTVDPTFTLDIPHGQYDEFEFEIHKVSDSDTADADFLAANPDFLNKSIRVQGTFNGQSFLFESDLDVEQELDLNPPLVIDETTDSTNITVLVGLDGWFVDGGGNLLNPESGNKGQPNESVIKENIKQSVEAFEDDDSDGRR